MGCASGRADGDRSDAAVQARRARRAWAAVVAVHMGLLAWSATRHSPTFDETGFLPAGLSHWMLGRFDLYAVNPPLVPMVATAPLFAFRPEIDWTGYQHAHQTRPEYWIGRKFQSLHKERAGVFFALARWACIPFSVLGAWVCFRWAGELYGAGAGLVATGLWCFFPNVLAHGALVSADLGGAALGVWAAYCFWRWLKEPGWHRAVLAGVSLGLAELAKLTLLIFFGLWPAIWLAWSAGPALAHLAHHLRCRAGSGPPSAAAGSGTSRHSCVKGPMKARWCQQLIQLSGILGLGIVLINAGYGFEGSFKPLGQYRFSSALLGGVDGRAQPGNWGNRFEASWFAPVPVPLPENYLRGIDRQRRDFEMKMWSYLRGEWRLGGWWHYYLYGLAIKEPLGSIALLVLAIGLPRSLHKTMCGWADQCLVLVPGLAILGLVSSQTGFNHHLRYVLPAMPFLYIIASRAGGMAGSQRRRWVGPLVVAALACSTASSLWIYPHSLSYFNEVVGGPRKGHRHLVDSNIDWGQDLLYLKRWCDAHPEARPLRLAYFGTAPPEIASLEEVLFQPAQTAPLATGDAFPGSVPEPGWYAASVHLLRSSAGRRFSVPDLRYLLELTPVATAGYSIFIYHITAEDADRLRCQRGLPPRGQPLKVQAR